jgi:ribosome maturation factor RimP
VDKNTLSALVEKSLEENQLSDCFLIDIKINNNKIEVYLDSDEQVTYAKCRKVSRYLEEVLDEKKWFGEKYTLDVSSAGVRRPLQFPRQYIKNIGRNIELQITDGGKYKGKLTGANEEEIIIEWEEKVKEGKKKKIVQNRKSFQYNEIKEAKIKISFN